MISGATYSGVPQNVQVLWPHLSFLAKPKSTWEKILAINMAALSLQSEVCWLSRAAYQLDVSICVQHEILRLQVSVYDAIVVEVVKGLCYTAHTELGSVFIKTASVLKQTCLAYALNHWTLTTWNGANLSLRRLQISPPKHASNSMYTYLLSLKVQYILSEKIYRLDQNIDCHWLFSFIWLRSFSLDLIMWTLQGFMSVSFKSNSEIQLSHYF